MKRISFSFVGLAFHIVCRDAVTESLVSNNFNNNDHAAFDAVALYDARKTSAGFLLRSPDGKTHKMATDAEFLYTLDKEITVRAQMMRSDLYFVHSAVIEFEGNAILLIGESGTGKSTLTWALLHHGFRYLSDELAPLDLKTMQVHPFPHAICLKNNPPAPYRLPKRVRRTSPTIHIPVQSMPSETCADAQPVRLLFFLKHDPSASEPSIARISPSEGAARLYSNTLNSLAHDGLGLEQAVSIAKRCQCFVLESASAEKTCLVLRDVVKNGMG